ncbi:MAG TPA: hypothetical protein VLV50_09010 [Stellaceae bacterium]|nr:hypothetical protein [Stellaceae bacterium]
MRFSMVVAVACLAAAAMIGARAYEPDLRRARDAFARAVRALARRPRHH